MRQPLKTYLLPIAFSIGFVLLSPIGLFAIFLSGDSCCGENTTATMVGVTAFIVAVMSAFAVGLSGAVKLATRKHSPDFSLPVASAIIAGPAALIYVVFVAFLSATAF